MPPMAKPHVLIIPFPAQGHMLPLLDLAAHLSASGDLTITILVTTKNLPLLSPLLSHSPSIHTLVLPFPHHPSLPSGVENTINLSPFYFYPMMHALSSLKPQILSWISSHPSPPTSIISDMFLGWTASLSLLPRICFSPSGALAISILHSLWRNMPDRDRSSSTAISFPSIPGSPSYPLNHLFLMYRTYIEGDPMWEFIKEGFFQNMSSWGHVINTFDSLEARYIEHLKEDLGHRRVWAVGPTAEQPQILSWLDLFEEGTVLYVGFGSQAGLAPPQTAALAAALAGSGVRFVWSVKGEGLPEGYEEEVEGRGRVMRGWAPQREVLGHRAVGWFLTHCGWNSAMEAAAAGVAVMTWPMSADQYIDEGLLVEEMGVGVRVWEGTEKVPDVGEMERVLRETVVEGGGRRPERRRAAELKRKAAEAVGDGGSSAADMAAMVRELFRVSSEKM